MLLIIYLTGRSMKPNERANDDVVMKQSTHTTQIIDPLYYTVDDALNDNDKDVSDVNCQQQDPFIGPNPAYGALN